MIECDRIYHLACPASPPHYQYNSIKTVKTAFMGTINMLGLAKRVKARFLLTSTSEIYGDPDIHPQQEDYWGNVNPIGIRACYDEGKRIGGTRLLIVFYFNSSRPQKPCRTATNARTASTSVLRASSTPTVRACTPTMAAW